MVAGRPLYRRGGPLPDRGKKREHKEDRKDPPSEDRNQHQEERQATKVVPQPIVPPPAQPLRQPGLRLVGLDDRITSTNQGSLDGDRAISGIDPNRDRNPARSWWRHQQLPTGLAHPHDRTGLPARGAQRRPTSRERGRLRGPSLPPFREDANRTGVARTRPHLGSMTAGTDDLFFHPMAPWDAAP